MATSILSKLSKYRDDFNGASLDTSKWTITAQGAGQTVGLNGTGALAITTGTTANETATVVSKFSCKQGLELVFQLTLSQRIANQTFYVGITDSSGNNLAYWQFDGTSATQAKYNSVSGGNGTVSSAVTTQSTAASTILRNIIINPSIVRFGDWAINLQTPPTNVYARNDHIPDIENGYYVYVSVVNDSSPPATDTTLTIGYILLQELNETKVNVIRGECSNSAGALTVVNAAGTALIGDFSPGVRTTSTNAETPYKVISAASTNATVVKASAGRLYGYELGNTSAADVFIHFYNKATAPTVGTDVPIFTLFVPADGRIEKEFGAGYYFSAGISYSITTGSADTDAGAVGLGDLVGVLSYA